VEGIVESLHVPGVETTPCYVELAFFDSTLLKMQGQQLKRQ
jgi:hypothetical protein